MRCFFIVTIITWLSICVKAIDFRTERIFVTTLGSEYAPGDSIDVSGIVLSSDSAFFPYSRYLYVEVINRNDSVLLRHKLSCDSRGKFRHRFQADLLWQPDIYYVRTYTRLMQNFNAKTFPIVPVQIGKRVIQPEFKVSDLKCSFYPEGGTLLCDALQNITVLLADHHEFPLSLPYYITCEGDTLCRQQTTRSGLQRIQLYMQRGKKYVLHTQTEGKTYQFLLPDTKEGIALQAVANHSRVSYQILASTPMDLTDYHLYAYHQDWGINKIALLNSNGIIDVKDLSPGLLSLFLLNHQNQLVSQRNLWLGKRKDASVVLDDVPKEYAPGETIRLACLSSQDTTKQVFSRIIKDNYWCVPHAENSLLWLCDLSSPLAFPMHYYQEPVADRRIDLEAWLATTGFIRFDLPSALSEGFSYPYSLEQCLALEGCVETRGGNPVKQSIVIAYHTDNGNTYQTETDDEGKFYLPVDDFKEGESFFLQAYTGKKKDQANFFKYKMKDDVFPSVASHFHVRKEQALNEAEVEIGYSAESAYGLDKNNLLPEIKVRAKVKADQYLPTKRFYKTNYIDAAHIKENNYTQMEDVIRAIPTVNLRKVEPEEDYIPGVIFSPSKQYKLTSARGSGVLGKKKERHRK